MTRFRSWFLVLALVAPLVSAGCGKTISDTMDDATVTARVKTAFINDPAVGAARIDVDTFRGVVTLSGSVKSQDQIAIATNLAQRQEGVQRVESNIAVR